jgi:hypothetical protein
LHLRPPAALFAMSKVKIKLQVSAKLRRIEGVAIPFHSLFFFFFQALNFLVESFGLLKDLFPLPSLLDAGYPVFEPSQARIYVEVSD